LNAAAAAYVTGGEMNRTRRFHAAAVGALALALAFAGCGDDSDEGTSGTSDSAAAASANATVSVDSVEGVGDVLVDSQGAALYTADQEMDGKVRCTGSCAEIWIPLTVSGSREPTASDDVPGELGVTERPGGERQVSYDGKPLYTFADDPMAGEVTGDGLSDTFDGRLFSWRVVRTGGGTEEGGAQPNFGPY
jgi:predicted lipoprotein with Yx(FWY)xxD motif